MANNQNLKDAISAVIKENGNNEITGLLLQGALLSVINQFGNGAIFKGIATPETAPGEIDTNVFYLASQAGTYANFNGFILEANAVAVISNISGSWVGQKAFNIPDATKINNWKPGDYKEGALVYYIGQNYRAKKNTSQEPNATSTDWEAVDFKSLKREDLGTTAINLYDEANNVTGKYVYYGGVLSESANTVINVIQVTPGTQYAVRAENINQTKAFFIGYRNSASTDTGEIPLISLSQNPNDANAKFFTVPDGFNHIFINIKLPNINWDISKSFAIIEGTGFEDYGINRVTDIPIIDLGALRKSSLSGSYPLYDNANNVTGRYVNPSGGGVINNSPTAVMNVFPVSEGKMYAVKTDDFKEAAFYIAFRETNSITIGSTLGLASLSDTGTPNVKTFIAPEGANFGFINLVLPGLGFDIINDIAFNEGPHIITSKTVNKIGEREIEDAFSRNKLDFLKESILKDKKWLLIGDSITAKNYRSKENYHYYLAETVGGMTRYNYGASGTGFFNRFNVADTITQTAEEIDLISIFLGTNDWGNQTAQNQKNLGVFLDNDTTTISGCINELLTTLIAKFPTKPIVLFTPLPRANNWGLNGNNNAYGYNLKDLCSLIIQYANHFSLPLLDLYSNSGLFPWNAEANTYYFKAEGYDPDGLHPNDNGHKWLANKMKAFLEASLKP